MYKSALNSIKRVKEAAGLKEYAPIKIVETRPMTSNHDENNITKDYMKKYGIDNVRGGSYCQVELPEEVEEVLRMEIKGNTDKCYNCGKKGHFANRCPNRESESEEEVSTCLKNQVHATDVVERGIILQIVMPKRMYVDMTLMTRLFKQ
jgi:hypothetical protein